MRPALQPPDPGQYRLLRRVWLGLAASLTQWPVLNPSTQGQGRQPLPTRLQKGWDPSGGSLDAFTVRCEELAWGFL